jgi:hypothetical protein
LGRIAGDLAEAVAEEISLNESLPHYTKAEELAKGAASSAECAVEEAFRVAHVEGVGQGILGADTVEVLRGTQGDDDGAIAGIENPALLSHEECEVRAAKRAAGVAE